MNGDEVQQAYDQWAATYDADQNATRDLDGSTLKTLIGQRRFQHIVEAGCGTGKNTAFLAGLTPQLTSLDFSEEMISRARGKASAGSAIAFKVADLRKPWPVESNSADLVTCNLVLEHISDLNPVFAEAARVLTAGGCLLVSELHPCRQYKGGVANFEREGETIRIPASIHHISDFLKASEVAGLTLHSLKEWWHPTDAEKPPRLVTFLFAKPPV